MTALVGLAGGFLLTAFVYAMVGFGGGSTYTALLVLAETDYRLLPAVSLACNTTVVTGSVAQYARAGLIPWKRLWPLVACSVPAAWIGGVIEIPERVFVGLLATALLASAVALAFRNPVPPPHTPRIWPGVTPLLGAGIGLLAGLVGIGGGIFLAPLLHLLRWDGAKAIAASAATFILANSIAGLLGQSQRIVGSGDLDQLLGYWPLLPAVLVGGQLGVWLGRRRVSNRWLARMTALLVFIVASRLLWRAAAG